MKKHYELIEMDEQCISKSFGNVDRKKWSLKGCNFESL